VEPLGEDLAAPAVAADAPGVPGSVALGTIAREWGRIGAVGFGGPPAHVALLRELCVARRGWLSEEDFEHAIAVTNLLPGPASTQLAIFCAWRLRGVAGAAVGALGFIVPGLVLIVALAALFLSSPPRWVAGVAAGAGAVVAPVAVQAALALIPASWTRARGAGRARWLAYLLAGAAATIVLGPWLVLVLIACGLVELTAERGVPPLAAAWAPWPVATVGAAGGLGALCWTALKVGALSYGGGFVIVPLMQADAVGHFHWMTAGEFTGAVALGQATPGPVVLTVAVVGYAAHGVGGALLAALVAFAPSLCFVALGARHFERLRTSPTPRAFLAGAGPAAIGAILGAAVTLAAALAEPWQYALLAGGAILLLLLRRGLIVTLLIAALVGALAALAGAPLPA